MGLETPNDLLDYDPIPQEHRQDAITAIINENPHMPEDIRQKMMEQMLRNGRWGTCTSCPRNDEDTQLPEKCTNTMEPDHWLGVDTAKAFT